MLGPLRGLVLALVLGFHNAWEQDDAALEDLGMRIRADRPDPCNEALEHPERCFFWLESSLLN
jgi:hypothetical protein